MGMYATPPVLIRSSCARVLSSALMEPFQRMERGRLLMAFLACDACRCLRERTQPRRADSREFLLQLPTNVVCCGRRRLRRFLNA